MKHGEVKSLEDIQVDMSELYDQVRDGVVELKAAGEMANIAGKFLKAEQLKLAREIFTSQRLGRAKGLAAELLEHQAAQITADA